MTPSSRDVAGHATTAATTGNLPTAHREPLPDLLGLSLGELRRLEHPVLSEILDELRCRMSRTGETLWDFEQGS